MNSTSSITPSRFLSASQRLSPAEFSASRSTRFFPESRTRCRGWSVHTAERVLPFLSPEKLWLTDESHVDVIQDKDCTCHAVMSARLEAKPNQVFEIFERPDYDKIFEIFKLVKTHRVIKNDGSGHKEVDLEFDAQWRFWKVAGTCFIPISMKMNKDIGKIDFVQKESGFLKVYQGSWSIMALTNDGQMLDPDDFPWFVDGNENRIENAGMASLVSLELTLKPSIVPPPPIHTLLKGNTVDQVESLFRDLKIEANKNRDLSVNSIFTGNNSTSRFRIFPCFTPDLNPHNSMTEETGISIRCRFPSGNVTLRGIDPSMSIHEFQTLLEQTTGISSDMQVLRVNYPPREVQLPENRSEVEIATLVLNEETVIVEERRDSLLIVENPMNKLSSNKTNSAKASEGASSNSSQQSYDFSKFTSTQNPKPLEVNNGTQEEEEEDESQWIYSEEDLAEALRISLAESEDNGLTDKSAVFEDGPIWREKMHRGSYIVRRFVDSDNSCLFTSVAYVMERNRFRGFDLRTIIAATVRSDPIQYNEGVLGRPNHDYCEWILNPLHWGGEIELLILSQYYRRQIAAYDVRSARAFVYGEDAGFHERVLLVYDGIHYDAIALSPFEDAPEDKDITVFNPNTNEGRIVLAAVDSFIQKLRDKNQFTDLSQFRLRCDECGQGFLGEPQALEHAKKTGHSKFSEYR
eukprot:g3203.t1